MEALRHLLHDPRIKGVDTDSPELLDAHRTILAEKPMMQSVFAEFYQRLTKAREGYFTAQGVEIELGAGISLFKNSRSEVITSDIKETPHCQTVIDAMNMSVADNSVAALYGINCFHHFPDPGKYFDELQRVLKPGGGAIMIEPYHGPFASILYSSVHDSEHFNKDQASWSTEGLGAMTGANQALSYLVFKRDLEVFLQKYPMLEVVEITRINNYIEYLVSGGLNFRQLLPTALIPAIKALQSMFTPISHLFALHQMIVIRRKSEG